MRRPRIGVVGSNMVDLIAYAPRMPVIGETLEAPSFEMGFGGKGATQAVAAAKLGAAVVMVSKVGDDMFARGTVDNLASFGIDTTHVHRMKGRSSGVAPIVVDPTDANAILIIKGANADLSPADVDEAAEALKSCDLILLQLEVPLDHQTGCTGAPDGVWPATSTESDCTTVTVNLHRTHSCFPHPIRPSAAPRVKPRVQARGLGKGSPPTARN